MELKNIRRDSKKIEAGQWVGDLPQMGDLRLHVRGQESVAYTTVLNRLMAAVPNDQRDRAGRVLPSAAQRCVAEAAHQGLLLDWGGLTENGKPVPYDSDTAYLWLTDPDFGAFLDAVLLAAKIVDHGKAEVEVDLTKKSVPLSNGISAQTNSAAG